MSNSFEEANLSEWLDNSELSVGTSGTLISYDVINTGTDTGTAVFFGKGKPGNGVQVRPSNNVTIESFNGRNLKSPITISTAGLALSKKKVRSFKIRTTAADVVVKVLVV